MKARSISILSKLGMQAHELYQSRTLLLNIFSNSTITQWTGETTKNIGICKQEIKCAMSLRSYVEILFKQVVEEVANQFNRTNEYFCTRMEEMRYAKIKLEGLHCGTANQVFQINFSLPPSNF